MDRWTNEWTSSDPTQRGFAANTLSMPFTSPTGTVWRHTIVSRIIFSASSTWRHRVPQVVPRTSTRMSTRDTSARRTHSLTFGGSRGGAKRNNQNKTRWKSGIGERLGWWCFSLPFFSFGPHLVFAGDEEAPHRGLARAARAHVQGDLLAHDEGLAFSQTRRARGALVCFCFARSAQSAMQKS